MTFLDKLIQEYPEKEIDINCSSIDCPSTYGYEAAGRCQEGTCAKCWNREIPNEGPTCDEAKAAYEQGLNDAWELAKKLVHFEYEGGFSDKEIQNIFDCDEWQCVFNALTPQEALAKLKAYEEEQKIEVGDVVIYKESGEKAVVVRKEGYNSMFNVLRGSGGFERWEESKFKKTGKHIDISSILEQIGE